MYYGEDMPELPRLMPRDPELTLLEAHYIEAVRMNDILLEIIREMMDGNRNSW
jgi:hypothetical protein